MITATLSDQYNDSRGTGVGGRGMICSDDGWRRWGSWRQINSLLCGGGEGEEQAIRLLLSLCPLGIWESDICVGGFPQFFEI